MDIRRGKTKMESEKEEQEKKDSRSQRKKKMKHKKEDFAQTYSTARHTDRKACKQADRQHQRHII